MAEMIRALQVDVKASAESIFLVKEKESMTTKRALTMLPHYSGKVENMKPGAADIGLRLVLKTTSTSSTCSCHRAPRGVLDGRDE